MNVQKYTDLIVWQKAHEAVLLVYAVTIHFPKEELFGLTGQIRRCAVSVPSNIVEGFKRNGKAEKLRFYNIAQGSLEELKYQVYLSHQLLYINKEKFLQINNLCEEVSKLLSAWIKVQK